MSASCATLRHLTLAAAIAAACLFPAAIVGAQASYNADATATLDILTAGVPGVFTVTEAPGTVNQTASASGLFPATAFASASSTANYDPLTQTFTGDENVSGNAKGAGGHSASSSALSELLNEMITATNVGTDLFTYTYSWSTSTSAATSATLPGDTATATGEAEILVNGTAVSPTGSRTLAAGTADIWTIHLLASGNAFSPSPAVVPEPASAGVLIAGLVCAAGVLRRKRA